MGTDRCGGAGHHRIAIGGHSGGAVRATYAQATERFDNVAAVIAVSPGEYDHEGVTALHGESFSGPFRESERNIAEGQPDVLLRPGIPWGSTWSARAYVDCFNRDNRYSVTTHAANTGCPTLYVFGAEESAVGGPQEIPVGGASSLGALGMAVYAVVGQVGFRANEPLKVRKVPLEDRVPVTKPGQGLSGTLPKAVGVLGCVSYPPIDQRIYGVHFTTSLGGVGSCGGGMMIALTSPAYQMAFTVSLQCRYNALSIPENLATIRIVKSAPVNAHPLRGCLKGRRWSDA